MAYQVPQGTVDSIREACERAEEDRHILAFARANFDWLFGMFVKAGWRTDSNGGVATKEIPCGISIPVPVRICVFHNGAQYRLAWEVDGTVGDFDAPFDSPEEVLKYVEEVEHRLLHN